MSTDAENILYLVFHMKWAVQLLIDKVDDHLERKKTMDFELAGYLESWRSLFGSSRLMVVNKIGQFFLLLLVAAVISTEGYLTIMSSDADYFRF